jgi:hypothetical protein
MVARRGVGTTVRQGDQAGDDINDNRPNIDATDDDDTNLPGPRPALLPAGYEEFYLGSDGQVHQFSVPVSVPNLGQYPGLPSSYTHTNQIARYYENDQTFIHIGDTRRKAASLSAESIAGYQMNMVVAGLLGEGSYQPGAWDKASIDANKELLQIANANGRTATSMLKWLANNSTFGEDEDEGAFLPTRVVADTETLKEITRQVARSRTGGVFLDDAEIEKITSGYQQAQRDQDARLRQGGGETEALPSAEVFAAGEIEKINPGGATANRFQSLTRTFMGLVGGGQ